MLGHTIDLGDKMHCPQCQCETVQLVRYLKRFFPLADGGFSEKMLSAEMQCAGCEKSCFVLPQAVDSKEQPKF